MKNQLEKKKGEKLTLKMNVNIFFLYKTNPTNMRYFFWEFFDSFFKKSIEERYLKTINFK